MVDFAINTNIFRIASSILSPVSKGIDELWFSEPITILTSNISKGTTIVIDFSYSISSIIEYSLNAGSQTPVWTGLNDNTPVEGGQSRFIRVTNGDSINFRAKTAGTLNRVILGEV